MLIAETYSEPCQTYKINLFAKMINGYKAEFKISVKQLI